MNSGHLATARYLLERCKAGTTGQTENKMNLIHAAVASGDLNMVKYILSKTKEHMHIQETATGATVLHIAAGEYVVLLFCKNKFDHNTWNSSIT